jgi:alkaline phosphatase
VPHVATSARRRWPLAVAVGSLAATAAFVAGQVVSDRVADDQPAPGAAHAGEIRRQDAEQPVAARNVILFVGDGMGSDQRNAARLAGVGQRGNLVMDSLDYAGLSKTHARDPKTVVTDSAAGGTAISTGVKTFNGAIAVDVDGNPVETLVEKAEAAGKVTGLVTTSQVTDATPASFGAHVEDRAEQSEIARQLIEETGVDVILGGGEDRWFPPGNPGAYPDNPAVDPEEESSSDQGDLVARARRLGYQYVSDAQGLAGADGDRLLGLFANEEMFQQKPEPDGIYNPVVSLPQMTRKALSMLRSHDEGFVLVVEEEAIDEMAHSNNAGLAIGAALQLDKAVAIGKRFAERHGDTLLITTADHETGGMTVEEPNETDESGDGDSTEDGPFDVAGSRFDFFVDWTTTTHTNGDVPVTAMGPGAKRLSGVYENTHIFTVMDEALFGR